MTTQPQDPREFDVILYGATGFTGRQTVDYFRRHAPATLRWAVAGRNRAKLEALQTAAPSIAADSTNPEQARALTARTRVLLSTAGPFALYSDELVTACVATRTHYTDIAGETVWVRSLIDRHHTQAAADGTRIVPFCGFDSVPSDLGVFLLAQRLGFTLTEVKAFFQVGGGRPNGGTIASAHYTYCSGADAIGRDLFLLAPQARRPVRPIEADPTRAAFDPALNAWTAPFPMSIIDTRVVQRSCALSGLNLVYQEYVGPLSRLDAIAVALGTGLFYTALRNPALRDLARRSTRAGSGPSEEAMDKGYFRCRMIGRTTDNRTAEVTLAGQGDPANRITVQCVCESALALACDTSALPPAGGVLTPSVGIGQPLVERIRTQGIKIAISGL